MYMVQFSCSQFNNTLCSFQGAHDDREPTAINKASPQVKRIPIQECSVLMGNIIGVNGYGANRALLSVLHPPLKLAVLAYYGTTVSSINGNPPSAYLFNKGQQ